MGETPQQLAGETSWPLAGETPWPLLGETLEQIAGETPQQLRGDNPQQLGGDTPQQLGGDTPQQLAGDTPQQLAGETPEQISGETPEQTAGETSQQLAGEVPERLAGEAPERLAREIVKQISGETPEQIAGETSQQLVGEAPERLAGEIPEQTAGETSQQLAGKAPEPLAERPHDKPQEDPSTSDGDCEVVWTSGPTPQESRTRPYRTAASRRTPYSMPDPSRRSPYVPPDARRSAYSTPVSRQAPGRANQKQNTKGSTVRRAGPTEQNRRSTLEQEPPFCFRCEELFPSRMWLEEHPCPAMTYICSCGTEFSMYMDMVQHSREHKPGQAVLDHATIRKRRVEMQVKDQLRWMKQAPLPQISVRSPQISARYSQITVRSPQIPMRPPPVSIAPWSSPAKLPAKAPTPITVGLWALYQPVVLIDTMRSFNKANPFQCATCDQGFATKNTLIRHHSAHLQEKVAGCLRCGMLLPTTRGVAKPHQCRSSNGALARTNNPTAVSLGKIVLPKVMPPSVHALYKHEASVMAHTVTAPVRAGSFRCNMCYVSFQSVKLLQKHKCPIAIDYVRRRQALMPNNQKRVNNKVIGPYALPKTNATELKVNIQAFRDIQAHHQKVAIPARASVIPARASAIPARTSAIPARASAVPAIRVNTEVDSDDDCIMIES